MKKMMINTIIMILLLGLVISGCSGTQNAENKSPSGGNDQAQQVSPKEGGDKVSPDQPEATVDSIQEQLKQMTLKEKVGQLVLVGIDGTKVNEETRHLIEQDQVGGIIFYKNNITDTKQALSLFNELKQLNRNNPAPLWMSIDEEGGRVTRLPDELLKLPTNEQIGKVDSVELSKQLGVILGRELSSFGLNMNFAPVLDVNSNPNNPVIGNRSFGNDASLVSRLGIATMKGMKSELVVPVIKHFPGHGDTSVDSHLGLPRVDHDLTRLRKLELIPFQQAIEDHAEVVMIAHLLMPKLDPELPASLSSVIIQDLLRDEMGFDGLVITDDMTMGAIVEHYDIGEASVKSIVAGGNIILVGHEYSKQQQVIKALQSAVDSGVITEEMLNERVYTNLKLKQAYKLDNNEAKGPDVKDINNTIRTLLDKYKM